MARSFWLAAPTIAALRPWITLSSACLAASLLSALQIYWRLRLEGGVPTLSGQLALNAVAWLPWVPLGALIVRAAGGWPLLNASGALDRKSFLRHAALAQLLVGAYLAYLTVFRFVFFPSLTGDLTWSSFARGVAREGASFYVTCLSLYGLIVVLATLVGVRPRRVSRDREAAFGVAGHGRSAAPRRLAIRSLGVTKLVDVARIDWIEAEGSYARLHIGACRLLLRRSLKSLSEELGPCGFARIHRSTLVNLERIASLAPATHGDAMVSLVDGRVLKVSRSYRADLEAAVADLQTTGLQRPRTGS
jgi:hypothetical protein